MEVVSRKSGARRVFAYRCYRSRRQGTAVCPNRLPLRMSDADNAVVDAVEETIMSPKVVARALALAEAEIVATSCSSRRDVGEVRAKLKSYVADCRKLLRGHVPQIQQMLRRLIVGKLTFTPQLNGDYEFVGRGTVRPLLAGVVRKLASPTGNRDYVAGPAGWFDPSRRVGLRACSSFRTWQVDKLAGRLPLPARP
jgi:hypothetical protein